VGSFSSFIQSISENFGHSCAILFCLGATAQKQQELNLGSFLATPTPDWLFDLFA
jgi:hypothetical protein